MACPLVLLSQVYSILLDRTLVDRQIDELKTAGIIKTVQIHSSSEDVIILTVGKNVLNIQSVYTYTTYKIKRIQYIYIDIYFS